MAETPTETSAPKPPTDEHASTHTDTNTLKPSEDAAPNESTTASALEAAAEIPHEPVTNTSVETLASVATAAHEAATADPEANNQLTESLRAQITDLYTQVTQLNAKLVQSYDSRANLEDHLHVTESTLQSSAARIASLEAERTEHLAALNTGLLVERSQVTAELTRLMERATEEAGKRGQAETAKQDIEKDLDDLSATLFSQANTMVAEARYARAMSERKVVDAETALKGAEEAVSVMQAQMQQMQAEMEAAQVNALEMESRVSKGKWVDRGIDDVPAQIWRLRTSHAPYLEFISFLTHLRGLRPAAVTPPPISSLTSLPFLSRLSAEDSDPTIRLDIAPALNWLSRRSVTSAIHAGQLMIEPMSTSQVLLEPPFSTATSSEVCCALCGIIIIPAGPKLHQQRPPPHPSTHSRPSSGSGSWFKSTIQAYASQPTGPPVSTAPPQSAGKSRKVPQQVYIFRLSPTAGSTAPSVTSVIASVNLPFPSSNSNSHSGPSPTPSSSSSPTRGNPSTATKVVPSTIYPLCSSWCLPRLRATCTLWAFLRAGVIEKVWDEPLPVLPIPLSRTITPPTHTTTMPNATPPPIPPRKRGLWGMASALGERAASWGEEKSKDKVAVAIPAEKDLPKSPLTAGVPPPLPPRNTGRGDSRSVSPVPASDTPPNLKPEVLPVASAEMTHTRGASSMGSIIFAAGPDHTDDVPESHPTTAVVTNGAHEPTDAFLTPAEEMKNPIESLNTAHDAEAVVEKTGEPSSDKTSSPILEPPSVEVKAAEDTLTEPHPPVAETAALDKPLDSVPKGVVASIEEPPATDTTTVPPPLPRRAARRVAPHPDEESKPASVVEASSAAISESAAVQSPPVVVVEPASEVAESHDTKPSAVKSAVGKVEEQNPVEPPAVESLANGRITPPPPARSTARTLKSTVVTVANDAVVNPLQSNGVYHDEAEVSEEGEMYVGYTTWEDKTWKELVRLREEMYWARVGAVKS